MQANQRRTKGKGKAKYIFQTMQLHHLAKLTERLFSMHHNVTIFLSIVIVTTSAKIMELPHSADVYPTFVL